MWQTSEKNYFSNEFANVWNIATGAGVRTHGCFWSSGSSRACTRPCHQVGGGKYPQAKIFTNIHDDAGNCRKQMCQNNISLIKIFRFNSVTGESERPSSLGPGFTAPPGGPEYLNRKVSNDEFCVSLKVWVTGWIDSITYNYQDCNELALLLLGSGSRWKWDLWSNSEVTIAELESYTMWWDMDDFQFNDKLNVIMHKVCFAFEWLL